jgi:soluble lytic murein transglycosylase-like protein
MMQVNDHSFPWFNSLDPADCINEGAGILAANMRAFGNDEFLAVAAYNAGVVRIRHAVSKIPPGTPRTDIEHIIDSYTTGRNYATDCLARRDSYLKAEQTKQGAS